MSNHSQRRNEGPSVASIGAGAGGTALALAATVWTAAGAGTARELTGALLGTVLVVLAFGWTAHRAIERVYRRDVIVRAAWREQERLAKLAETTGTWTGENPGEVFSIRYAPDTGRFHVQGWLGGDWRIPEERLWLDIPYLVDIVVDAESQGMVPCGSAGGIRVRTELGLHRLTWPPEDPDTSAAWPLPVDGEGAGSRVPGNEVPAMQPPRTDPDRWIHPAPCAWPGLEPCICPVVSDVSEAESRVPGNEVPAMQPSTDMTADLDRLKDAFLRSIEEGRRLADKHLSPVPEQEG